MKKGQIFKEKCQKGKKGQHLRFQKFKILRGKSGHMRKIKNFEIKAEILTIFSLI